MQRSRQSHSVVCASGVMVADTNSKRTTEVRAGMHAQMLAHTFTEEQQQHTQVVLESCCVRWSCLRNQVCFREGGASTHKSVQATTWLYCKAASADQHADANVMSRLYRFLWVLSSNHTTTNLPVCDGQNSSALPCHAFLLSIERSCNILQLFGWLPLSWRGSRE